MRRAPFLAVQRALQQSSELSRMPSFVKVWWSFLWKCATRWSHAAYLVSALLLFEAALCALIIARKPYTKIDWDAYVTRSIILHGRFILGSGIVVYHPEGYINSPPCLFPVCLSPLWDHALSSQLSAPTKGSAGEVLTCPKLRRPSTRISNSCLARVMLCSIQPVWR